MKPGKPTLAGKVRGKAVLGLPGHPVAAFFTAQLFVRFLLAQMMGRRTRRHAVTARLEENLGANHGRSQYQGVRLTRSPEGYTARPVWGKSGLITSLAATDGYLCIPRDCEGLPAGAEAEVFLYTVEEEENGF